MINSELWLHICKIIENIYYLTQEAPLEKEMVTHSSNLVWEIPWTEEPGRLQSMGLQRAGHDLVSEHMHERYNFWKTKNMCFARVDKTFSFCLRICGLWSMVLSFFFFGTISVVPNIQQG